jgi:membrane protease YdiL (CAAX protease family)
MNSRNVSEERIAQRYLWGEFCLLFLGLPLVMALDWLPGHKILWLGGATLGCGLWLFRSREAPLAPFRRPGSLPRGLARRIFVCALALAALVLLLEPDRFLELPRRRPQLWLLITALYPLLSAFPQEVIYRQFFFKRYAPLFSQRSGLVLVSGLAFAYLHVIYANIPALILSLAGGLLLARSYAQHRSLFWVSVEHAAYGLLVFTLGLGRYFYQGP